MKSEKIHEEVKRGYARIVKQNTQKSVLPKIFTCCNSKDLVVDIGKNIGYSKEELENVPEDSNLGIGCGNPTALAFIQKGETILDLGSGAGFDCFIASKATGDSGKVIGIDITPEMVAQAQKNAAKGNYTNVEFIIGEIENLPILDETVDLVISNCVINLSNQKQQVFNEAYRVLKPSGRIMISDIILLKELPDYIKNSVEGHIACLAGAIHKEDYINTIAKAGFSQINIDKEAPFPLELMMHDPIAIKILKENNLSQKEMEEIANSIASVSVSAIKN